MVTCPLHCQQTRRVPHGSGNLATAHGGLTHHTQILAREAASADRVVQLAHQEARRLEAAGLRALSEAAATEKSSAKTAAEIQGATGGGALQLVLRERCERIEAPTPGIAQSVGVPGDCSHMHFQPLPPPRAPLPLSDPVRPL